MLFWRLILQAARWSYCTYCIYICKRLEHPGTSMVALTDFTLYQSWPVYGVEQSTRMILVCTVQKIDTTRVVSDLCTRLSCRTTTPSIELSCLVRLLLSYNRLYCTCWVLQQRHLSLAVLQAPAGGVYVRLVQYVTVGLLWTDQFSRHSQCGNWVRYCKCILRDLMG